MPAPPVSFKQFCALSGTVGKQKRGLGMKPTRLVQVDLEGGIVGLEPEFVALSVVR